MCLFGVPKCHQFGWKFPFFHFQSYCHRERYFSIRELDILFKDWWEIQLFCSKPGWTVSDIWQIRMFFRRRKKLFWRHFISVGQLGKSDKTLARSSLTRLVMQIEDRLKNVVENIKPSLFTDKHRYIKI